MSAQKYFAVDPDSLPGIFYKQLAGALTLPMIIVFKQSVNQGAIPDAWRLALVAPLYKGKGDKTLLALYRPISQTHVACKLWEGKIVNKYDTIGHIVHHCAKKQHGCVPHQ